MIPLLKRATHGVVRFQQDRYWAENGCIHSERDTDGKYVVMSRRTALHRLKSINDLILRARSDMRPKSGGSESNFDHITLLAHVRFVEEMTELIWKAKHQGDPNNPDDRRALVRGRPVTVAISNPKTSPRTRIAI